MTLDPRTLLAIFVMGVATYACRGGGYWLFRQIRPSQTVRAMLGYLPGTLFVSFVLPALVQGGLQPMAGAAACVGVMLATRNMVLSILVGVAAAWGVWLLR